MPDAFQFSLDVLCRGDIAIREMAEVELDAGLQAPFERHFIDGPGSLAPVHGRMEVPGRVQMGAVVSRQLHLLDGPALPVWKIFGLQSLEELQHARQALLMI